MLRQYTINTHVFNHINEPKHASHQQNGVSLEPPPWGGSPENKEERGNRNSFEVFFFASPY